MLMLNWKRGNNWILFINFPAHEQLFIKTPLEWTPLLSCGDKLCCRLWYEYYSKGGSGSSCHRSSCLFLHYFLYCTCPLRSKYYCKSILINDLYPVMNHYYSDWEWSLKMAPIPRVQLSVNALMRMNQNTYGGFWEDEFTVHIKLPNIFGKNGEPLFSGLRNLEKPWQGGEKLKLCSDTMWWPRALIRPHDVIILEWTFVRNTFILCLHPLYFHPLSLCPENSLFSYRRLFPLITPTLRQIAPRRLTAFCHPMW